MITGWSSHRYYQAVEPEVIEEMPILGLPGQHVKSQRFVGVTDSGREIPLYRWKADNSIDPKIIATMIALLTGPSPSVIQREEPDQRSNCHGWVFTRGRFRLAGQHVDHILTDNHYEAVTLPRAGDVIIYRNADGGIVHTGLVAGILADDSVMIESKWSVGARYLHTPEAQPYSLNFSYYRTARASHSLAIRPQDNVQIAGRKSESSSTNQRSTAAAGKLIPRDSAG